MKKLINVFGVILTLSSIYFLYSKYQALKNTLSLDITTYPTSYYTMPFIYTLSAIALALAWGRIITVLYKKVPINSCLAIYGISQIGKYVPGNVFHYVGKQFLGVAYGIPGKELAKSQFYEIILQLLSAIGFAIYIGYGYLFPGHNLVALLIMAFAMILIFVTLYFYNSMMLPALFFYMLFLCALGALFASVIKMTSHFHYDAESLFFIISAFAAAWLIGFVIPGAPAGIGVREAVLILLLTPSGLAEHDVFSSAILFRIVSVCGDFVFFLLGMLLYFVKKDKLCGRFEK